MASVTFRMSLSLLAMGSLEILTPFAKQMSLVFVAAPICFLSVVHRHRLPPSLQLWLWSTKKLSLARVTRSEEHTSELQSLAYLVCRLLLEKKKKNYLLRYSRVSVQFALIYLHILQNQ